MLPNSIFSCKVNVDFFDPRNPKLWKFGIFTFLDPSILSRLGDVGRREYSFVADEMINTPASEIISSATKEDSLLPSFPDGASRLGGLSKIDVTPWPKNKRHISATLRVTPQRKPLVQDMLFFCW
jgi:hypothetical protein